MTSPELFPLLHAVGDQLKQRPVDLAALRSSLEALLIFLASPVGRTNDNCHDANAYFAGPDWDSDYSFLPEGYALILDDMAMQLHDTVSAPEIAEMFESTPEQLLDRLRAVGVST